MLLWQLYGLQSLCAPLIVLYAQSSVLYLLHLLYLMLHAEHGNLVHLVHTKHFGT